MDDEIKKYRVLLFSGSRQAKALNQFTHPSTNQSSGSTSG